MLNKTQEHNDERLEITTREEAGSHVICIEGMIDVNNAKEFEQKLQDLVAQEKDRIILDVEKLYYISSAGLRGLIRLQGSLDEKMIVINVSEEIFEVFEMTGFTEIMLINKKPRKITVNEDQIIGKGVNGTTYRIDDDTVVKVYHQDITMQELAIQKSRSSKAFLAGVPTIITYDVVEVGGKLGIVFELARGSRLSEKLNNEPENFDSLVIQFAGFLREIHSKSVPKGEIPDVKDAYYGFVDTASYMDDKQKEMLRELIRAVPETNTVLHGDFHANNILVEDGEMLAIDLDDISLGNPLFDLGAMALSHVIMGRYNPDLVRFGLGIDYETMLRVWAQFTEHYFENDPPEVRAQKRDLIERFAFVKVILSCSVIPGFDKYIGWQHFDDSCKVLFEPENYSKLINDIKAFRV